MSGMLAEAGRGFKEVVGRDVSGFCCPLCLRELDLSCSSVAHAPAEALGGRPVAFLCRHCNSYLGTAFEASAIETARSAPVDGRQRLTVRFGRQGGPMLARRAVIETDSDGVPHLTLDGTDHVAAYVLADFEDHRDGPMSLQFRGESGLKTKLAFLSWAFLALFARFGYSYVLAPCSRPVRDALIDGRPTFGNAFFMRSGDLPSKFRDMTIGQTVIGDEHPDGGRGVDFVGLGVDFGGTVSVTVPQGYDPMGDLVRGVEGRVDAAGVLQARGAVVPFDLLFEEATATSYLDRGQTFHFSNDDGSVMTIIGTSALDAESTLSRVRVPVSKRRGRRARSSIRSDWEASIRPVVAHLPAAGWGIGIGDDLAERLVAEGSELSFAAQVQDLARTVPADDFVTSADEWLEPHLASHVRDSYRLFVLAENPLDWPEPRNIDVLERVRALMDAANAVDAVLASKSFVVAHDRHVSNHALVVADGDRELVLGGYYSEATLLLAAEVLLSRWL